MSVSKKKLRDIQGNKYQWKFRSVVKKLLDENPRCHVCGSTEHLDVHHINRTQKYKDNYYNEDNLVVICKKCHKSYHSRYNDENVNAKTFVEFGKKRSLGKLQSRNAKLQNEMKLKDAKIAELEKQIIYGRIVE